jgi:urease accessory protein
MYLSSPSLPIGAFAWSRGLEAAIGAGLVADAPGLRAHVSALLARSLGTFDLPILAGAFLAGLGRDVQELAFLDRLSLAGRESSEFRREEEEEGGGAIRRLMLSLDLWPAFLDASFRPGQTAGFALLSLGLGLGGDDLQDVLGAFAFGFLQNQISVAARSMRIGQSGLQAVALSLGREIPGICRAASDLAPRQWGSGLVGLSILSAHHELAAGRLFRS